MKVKGILTVSLLDTPDKTSKFWCMNSDAPYEMKRFGDAGYTVGWEPMLTYIPDEHPMKESDYERAQRR